MKESHSTRLRATLSIAETCDFEYKTKPHKFGGFFSVFQLEKVVRTIEKLKAREQELKREIEIIKSIKQIK